MGMKELKSRAIQVVFTTILALTIVFAAGPAMSAEGVDPEADKILRSMSDYLNSLGAFSVNADIDSEIIDLNGQKLQLSSVSSVTVERPGKMYVTKKGMIADAEFIFDGKILTVLGKNLNVYVQYESSGAIDNSIHTLEFETGMDMPGADFLLSDPYNILIDGVKSGAYMGTTYVHGVECHYLTFREDQVDWQIWVKKGEAPLPMKYVITTKWLTGAPQYSLRLWDWNTKPQIEPSRFEFTAPEGARKVESIKTNGLGKLIIEEIPK